MGSTTPPPPYWNINIPSPLHQPLCPPFLQNLSQKDLSIISTPDSQYTPLTWPSVQNIVKENRLDEFQRVPSQLRRYLGYIWEVRKKEGGVLGFVRSVRLGWGDECLNSSVRVEDREGKRKGDGEWEEEDVKILWNDWPYGIDERIVHLVVWTKFELEDDPATGDLTEKARREIDVFVERKFKKKIGGDNVIWFKNWKSLKSVHAVEHFHVMLFDPDPEFVKEITNGDIPLSRKLAQ